MIWRRCGERQKRTSGRPGSRWWTRTRHLCAWMTVTRPGDLRRLPKRWPKPGRSSTSTWWGWRGRIRGRRPAICSSYGRCLARICCRRVELQRGWLCGDVWSWRWSGRTSQKPKVASGYMCWPVGGRREICEGQTRRARSSWPTWRTQLVPDLVEVINNPAGFIICGLVIAPTLATRCCS
jgi:hypothetical protein